MLGLTPVHGWFALEAIDFGSIRSDTKLKTSKMMFTLKNSLNQMLITTKCRTMIN